jgi:hypothetical protein
MIDGNHASPKYRATFGMARQKAGGLTTFGFFNPQIKPKYCWPQPIFNNLARRVFSTIWERRTKLRSLRLDAGLSFHGCVWILAEERRVSVPAACAPIMISMGKN